MAKGCGICELDPWISADSHGNIIKANLLRKSRKQFASIRTTWTRAGSLNHFSGEPDLGEPTFHQ